MKIVYACMERGTCIRNIYFEVIALLYIVLPARNNKTLRITLLLRKYRRIFLKVRVPNFPTLTTSDT
jgi:hypothetical protein